MIITKYNLHTREELFDIIRRTTLQGAPEKRPFQDSRISIQTVSYHDVIPTQTFVLREQLDKIDEINRQMLRHGINLFQLDGFLSYQTDETSADFVFTPPIVEVIDNQPLIIDGQHRTIFAADNNMQFNALFIENIDPAVYPYQLPLRGGWNAVQRFDNRLPDGFIRKERRYLNGTHKYYFREHPFPGIIKLAREHTGR